MGVFLTDTQRATLVDVLDLIIPEKGEMPSAGQIATDYVESAATASSITARVVLDSLMAIDAAAGSHHSQPFSDIADSAKETLLKMVEEQNPELFSEFVDLAYSGYYTNTTVIERLGPDAGTPQPKGLPSRHSTRRLWKRYAIWAHGTE